MASKDPNDLSAIWKLSLYELFRSPQEHITNDEIDVSPQSVDSELMCPICLDLLKKTMTTKECLHRYYNNLYKVTLNTYQYIITLYYLHNH